jgi:hypothetical protein
MQPIAPQARKTEEADDGEYADDDDRDDDDNNGNANRFCVFTGSGAGSLAVSAITLAMLIGLVCLQVAVLEAWQTSVSHHSGHANWFGVCLQVAVLEAWQCQPSLWPCWLWLPS